MSFSYYHNGEMFKVSLGDVFKSTKELKDERDALIRKREEAAKKKAKEAKVVPPKQQQQQNQKQENNDNSNKNKNDNSKKDNNNKGKDNNRVDSEKNVHAVPPKPNEFSHPSWGNPNRHNFSWTDADDATLLRMIGSNFQWPMIAAALGRQVNEVESRWNQIRPDRGAHNNGKGDPQKAGGQQDKSGANKGGAKADNSSKKAKGSPVIDNLTVEEAVLLNTLASKYEDDKWLRISSRFYDKTGKRIHAQDVKKHVQQSQGKA